MSGVPNIKIVESVEELKSEMKKQKTALNFAKVQALYLLKIQAAETVRYLAVIMGRAESTIHSWLQLYRQGGLVKLLEEHPKTGRPKKLDIETVAKIQQELSEPEGFLSYKEVKLWLYSCQNIEISYPTIHRVVRYELNSKLKVPRPCHEKQQPGIISAFKQHLPTRIKGIFDEIKCKWGKDKNISYWCQDETRIGFRTELGRKITLKGIKPKQEFQWHYNYYYMYGLIEPITGRSFFYEFSHFNSDCLGIYLRLFAQKYPKQIHIIQLDNAPIHTAKKLKIPDNIILLFQPPYCPEVNPIERVWEYIKYYLRSLWFIDLKDVKDKVASILNSLDNQTVISLSDWKFFSEALCL